MIDCVFTLDYEIHGNGTGTLRELVLEPGKQLKTIFQKWNARFVNFVEAAEFERISELGADSDIDLVRRQIKELYIDGFEIGLHLHPQWCNARYEQGHWVLDLSEYNLCTLGKARITKIVTNSINYLRSTVDDNGFTPLSFRAGNWLFQPTSTAASVLAEHGIRIDSSVFKGGVQHNHGLDYRRAMKNSYFWPFSDDVCAVDPNGDWIEVPIYTAMVPFWKMPTSKRMSFGNAFGAASTSLGQKVNRIRDFTRFQYPLKFDFCRMTREELTTMLEQVVEDDRSDPEVYRPIVAIGHTKDLSEPQTVDYVLSYLRGKAINVATFKEIHSKLLNERRRQQPSSLAANGRN